MKNSKRVILAVLLCMAIMLTGCVEKSIDPDKYVTLGQYKGVAVTALSLEVTDEDIAEEIRLRLDEYSELEPITDRPLQIGDIANIDFTGYIVGETEPFEGGSSTAYEFQTGQSTFIPGMEEQIIGMSVGEEKTIDVTFPEDYHSADLAGVAVTFDIKLNSIQQKNYPELTDSFVSENFGFSNVAAFNEGVVGDLNASRLIEQEDGIYQDAWIAVLDNATVISLPQDKIETTKTYLNEMYASYASYYSVSLDEFILLMGMTSAEYTAYIQEYAESSVTEEMVARAVAKAENIKATDDEINNLINYYMNQYGYTDRIAFFSEVMSRDEIEMSILYDHVLTFVSENAAVAY